MEILIKKTILVSMRDKVSLATDIYRIKGEGPMPALLRRLPYNKEAPKYLGSPDILKFVQAGFAVVVQDVRGTGASEGKFVPFTHEADDGEDTINWIANQPWCNGKVGMFGSSYHGMTQWLATKNKPKALKAIAPHMSPSDIYGDLCYRNGAFEFGASLSWTTRMFFKEVIKQLKTEIPDHITKIAENGEIPWDIHSLPTEEAAVFSNFWPIYEEWQKNNENKDYWKSVSFKDWHDSIGIPVLNSGGWYDIFLRGTISNYIGMKKYGANEIARDNQRLILGPWSHTNYTGTFPERDFGNQSSIDAINYNDLLISWFNKWLKGTKEEIFEGKPVKIFIMGIDQWREEEDYPLPDTKYIPYYLHSKGNSNTSTGSGLLSIKKPEEEPFDEFVYDPNNPVPTHGGSVHFPNEYVSGPHNQSKIEEREDVLCYTTVPFVKDIEVTGPVKLEVYVASDALDTDFTGKLVDVFPDGRAVILTEGILRTRYRNSTHSSELMKPGNIYKLNIEMGATSNVFKSEHCIRLEISSSNFPKYDRNSNTGKDIFNEDENDLKVAFNRIHHSHIYPSHLILPVIERG